MDDQMSVSPPHGAGPKVPETKKSRRGGAATAGSPLPERKQKRHSPAEKLEKLRRIDEQLVDKKSTLRQAVKEAGISEQTYYIWKRSAASTEQVMGSHTGDLDEFSKILRLEDENQRLRVRLAEKLRSENADLKRRLGL